MMTKKLTILLSCLLCAAVYASGLSGTTRMVEYSTKAYWKEKSSDLDATADPMLTRVTSEIDTILDAFPPARAQELVRAYLQDEYGAPLARGSETRARKYQSVWCADIGRFKIVCCESQTFELAFEKGHTIVVTQEAVLPTE